MYIIYFYFIDLSTQLPVLRCVVMMAAVTSSMNQITHVLLWFLTSLCLLFFLYGIDECCTNKCTFPHRIVYVEFEIAGFFCVFRLFALLECIACAIRKSTQRTFKRFNIMSHSSLFRCEIIFEWRTYLYFRVKVS